MTVNSITNLVFCKVLEIRYSIVIFSLILVHIIGINFNTVKVIGIIA